MIVGLLLCFSHLQYILYLDHTPQVLVSILILCRYINFTGEKNIVAYPLSRLPLNGNEDNTQKSTYQIQIWSGINYTKELPEGTFPIKLILIQKY